MSHGAGLGSTYRLQLNGLGFVGARALVPYLHRLGIETLYVSPVCAAAPGSTHGYDVIDPTRLDPALGSPEDFEDLLTELGCARHAYSPRHRAEPHGDRSGEPVVVGHPPARSGVAPCEDLRHRLGPARWTCPDPHPGPASLGGLGRGVGAPRAGRRPPRTRRPGLPARSRKRRRITGACALWPRSTTDLPSGVWVTPPAITGGSSTSTGSSGSGSRTADVFDRTHQFVLGLCADERVAGLRVDHVDGLADPARYLDRLGEALARAGGRPCILVEKILGRDEVLDRRWKIDGTTGYEFGDRAGGLFVLGPGCQELAQFGSDFTGSCTSFEELATIAKREMLQRTFSAQLDRLARAALCALDSGEPGHDLSLHDVRGALAELSVHLDVYRTYLDGSEPSRADRLVIARAVERARAQGGRSGADPGDGSDRRRPPRRGPVPVWPGSTSRRAGNSSAEPSWPRERRTRRPTVMTGSSATPRSDATRIGPRAASRSSIASPEVVPAGPGSTARRPMTRSATRMHAADWPCCRKRARSGNGWSGPGIGASRSPRPAPVPTTSS